jgi:hypothetical protein
MLVCTGSNPGTWTASFGGVELVLVAQTTDPFSLTFELTEDVSDCTVPGGIITAGAVFVVTIP